METEMLPVAVVDEEAMTDKGAVPVLARFATIGEAEDYIAELEKTQPDKVHRGGFGIDAPDTAIN